MLSIYIITSAFVNVVFNGKYIEENFKWFIENIFTLITQISRYVVHNFPVLIIFTSAVLEALMPIFFSAGPLVTPPNALSTTKAVTLSTVLPVFGSLIGVWAKTVITSANPPLLIQILDPFKM